MTRPRVFLAGLVAVLLGSAVGGVASAAPPANAPSCDVSGLSLADTVASDRNPDGSPVTATPAASGHLVPVIMVHGWTGSSEHPGGAFSTRIDLTANTGAGPVRTSRSLIGQLQRIPGAAVYTFDYHRYSGRWVSDANIGPALGKAIDCLHRKTGQRVIVIGHSMGGLAARWAVNHRADNGRPRADEVSTVVTFGTPNLGSQLNTLAAGGVLAASDAGVPVATVVQALLTRCGQISSRAIDDTSSGTLCDSLPTLIRAIDGEAGLALRVGSRQLQELGGWPPGVAVHALAGENVMQVPKTSGWFNLPWQTSAVPIGDVPVRVNSAVAGSTTQRQINCDYQLNPYRYGADQVGISLRLTATADVAQPVWKLTSPCYHSNLMRTIELTNEAMGAVADDIAARQPTTEDQVNTAPRTFDEAVTRVNAATAADPSRYEYASYSASGTKYRLGGAHFRSPSGNIQCSALSENPGELYCYIQQHTFIDAPDPGCGEGPTYVREYVRLRGSGADQQVCTGGVQHAQTSNVLPYGSSLRFGPFACVSEQAGMTCVSTEGRHGFALSRESLVRF